ncbi:Ger(x)C family spore germination protein [Cohnella silvisoli]|uniref:Ger(X)C family spore germination protein n=1 Tax=Cohnella silvisoli TaxID=2873699 RepID=A0ABV1KNX8_9BACL|nr:Ger(x)C family spore germination protein [Cohnella silvisoli]MCD9020923.1 Ger(x)C family spore germination protein [Cohnella silvisoli]
MRKLKLIVVGLFASFALSGCWNAKDIQNLAYVTAIGLDYVNGQYITYVQILNFANVGKTENMEIGKIIPIWIGKGEGKTISQSITSIYSTSQMRLFWGHVKAIVCTENILKRGVDEAFDALNRYREIRYNVLIYGTRENLSDIFTQKSIFNLSPLDTIMFTPEQIYLQRSSILPINGNLLAAKLNEPGEPAMLPSLSINKTVWKEDIKNKPMLQINGAYFFTETKMTAWLSEEDLAGARWTQPELKRSLINVPADGTPQASLVLIKPHYKVKLDVRNGEVRYDVHLKISANLDELLKDIPIKSLEEKAEKVVRDQIVSSYVKGLEKKVDVLKLDEILYRDHPKIWHKMHRSQSFTLIRESLRRVDVKINLVNTGKYKARKD